MTLSEAFEYGAKDQLGYARVCKQRGHLDQMRDWVKSACWYWRQARIAMRQDGAL